jgi:hypothetical protein
LFHKQQNKVCCPDLHVIGEKEGEDYKAHYALPFIKR